MGRQINFYMSENVQLCFLGYLKKEKFLFLDKNRRIIKEPNAKEVFGMYLYKADYGSIIMRQDDKEYMDSIKSPVIQYNKTMIKGETKQIIRGRLWIANQSAVCASHNVPSDTQGLSNAG